MSAAGMQCGAIDECCTIVDVALTFCGLETSHDVYCYAMQKLGSASVQ